MELCSEEAVRLVWEGAIPLQIHLHESEVTTLPPPPPVLVFGLWHRQCRNLVLGQPFMQEVAVLTLGSAGQRGEAFSDGDENNSPKFLEEEVVVVCGFQVIPGGGYDKGGGLKVETIERKLLRLGA
ncbi:hypothetical protein IEQ34_001559 [Dendrobium chrysotoxum]|uniref:Uncharacterized protein n=1 Tax=Dendrobium chrysotoxum TaxID=161865 RepID=A0AAV7HN07_DENCH|nr:hypothetical protein IEQ34_001559 [Dendrobium chrysotoxum]